MADDITVTGLDAILKKLEYLDTKGADKVLCAMIRAQLTVIGKQMKADVDPRVKEGAKAVKTRFKRNRKKNWVMAKVGFGVGKKQKKAPKVVNRKGNRNGGVGISQQNIHWWVAGTKQRYTGNGFYSKPGAKVMYRGAMPSMQPRLAAIAATKSIGKQNTYMVKMGALRLEKELAVMQGSK